MKETEKNLETAYTPLAKKYGLPGFAELDREFDLHDEGANTYILRQVLHKIFDKIEFFTKMLEDILHPETTLSGLYESKFFDENKKGEFFQTYKRLMAVNRQSITAYAQSTEESEAESIKKAWKEWTGSKEELSKIAQALSKGWEEETDTIEQLNYMG
jgi:hypothetical protein